MFGFGCGETERRVARRANPYDGAWPGAAFLDIREQRTMGTMGPLPGRAWRRPLAGSSISRIVGKPRATRVKISRTFFLPLAQDDQEFPVTRDFFID
jgi:hypothetical protein